MSAVLNHADVRRYARALGSLVIAALGVSWVFSDDGGWWKTLGAAFAIVGVFSAYNELTRRRRLERLMASTTPTTATAYVVDVPRKTYVIATIPHTYTE